MSVFQGIGSLLEGLTKETSNIRQERENKAQKDLSMKMDIFKYIIDNPQITNPQLKQEALEGVRDTAMQHLFPDNYKSKPGKLHKIVDEFIGQNPAQGDNSAEQMLQGLGRGEGAGRGNAKSAVGGLPPAPTQAMGAPPTAGMFGADAQQPAPDGAAPQAPQTGLPPSPAQAGIAAPQGVTTQAGFQDATAQATSEANTQVIKDRVLREAKTKDWESFSQSPELQRIKKENPLDYDRLFSAFMGYGVSALPVGYTKPTTLPNRLNTDQAMILAQQNGLAAPNPQLARTWTAQVDAQGKVVAIMPTESKQAKTVIAEVQGKPKWVPVDEDGNPIPETPEHPYLDARPTFSESGATTVRQALAFDKFNNPVLYDLTTRTERGPNGQSQTGGNGSTSLTSPTNSSSSLSKVTNPKQQLTEQQVVQYKQDVGTTGNAISVLTDLTPMYENPDAWARLRTEYLKDPHTVWAWFFANQLPDYAGSDEEKKFAGLSNSLQEHIQKLREPLGATGFRSFEAFQNLMTQGGNLLAAPETNKAVVTASLKSLMSTYTPKWEALHPEGHNPSNIPDEVWSAYGTMTALSASKEARGDTDALAKKTIEMLKKDGWFGPK